MRFQETISKSFVFQVSIHVMHTHGTRHNSVEILFAKHPLKLKLYQVI